MSDATPEPGPALDAPADAPPRRPRGRKRRAAKRWGRRGFALAVALVASLLVAIFSIDLGRLFPQLRHLAEQQASNYLERPAHIGRISALLAPGDFAVDDLVIEGRHASDRPFMRVGRVTLHVDWWRIFTTLRHPDIHLQVRLTDWQMVVENGPGGHNLPKLTPKSASKGRRPYTVTVDYVYAIGGHFTYDDHGTPWSIDAPGLSFSLARSEALQQYVGRADFSGGTLRMLSYRPMTASLSTRFVLDGPRVHLQHIDLTTDGTSSHVNGLVDFSRWPEQVYYVNSSVHFATMREIFFPNESWRLAGDGQFTGAFRFSREGARELAGDFTSDTASVNDLVFPHLHGGLIWTNTRFAVTHAESDLLGGRTRFQYALAPLGTPTGATATFSADYENADLFDLDRVVNWHGLRLAGVASGSLSLEWANGHFGATRHGEGHTAITPPAGIGIAPTVLPATPLPAVAEAKPFDPNLRNGPITIGGDIQYQIDPGGITFDPSWTATTRTYVSYRGRLASGGSSEFPFHVTSHDWQESDRLLAAIMTAVSGPTGAVEVGGRGTFDGVMTGSFSSPRIDGHFVGDALRVWDVTWGRAVSDLVIENHYVEIAHSLVTGPPGASIVADGRYALGFLNDGREEIHAGVHLQHWPMADLRHAFSLDDWPMDGTIGAADLTLTGRYKAMFGSGRLRIDNGRAWKERFDRATGDLVLEGTGLRINGIELHKASGIVTGAAQIGWDGTYAFHADADGIPVESLDNFQVPQAPLSGRLHFTADGAGEFSAPRYSFDGSILDLFVGSEGIGAVAGRFTVSGKVMSIERFQASSGRLDVNGSGTIAFDDKYTSDLRVRFQQTALDPYLKFVLSQDVSPYTRILVGGSVAVHGPLASLDGLAVDATIDDASLTLFDYELRNDGPVRLRLDDGVVRIAAPDGSPARPAALTLKGHDTNLTLTGGADTRARTVDLRATGDASLSILQFKLKTLTASGSARLDAALTGSFDAPRLTGGATLADGRLRPLDSPHSLEAINGRIAFGPDPETRENTVTLDGVTGRIGNGDVRFGGTIALDRNHDADFNLTAQGRSMRLRYPDGFNSIVNMNLTLTGTQAAAQLRGTVDVLDVRYIEQAQSSTGLLALIAGTPEPARVAAAPAASTFPLTLGIRVTAPRMPIIDTKNFRVDASADLRLEGTFDEPIITGEIDIAGGQTVYNGNRYFIQPSTIEFRRNGDHFEPVFNVAVETRPRLNGDTYVVDVQLTGTLRALTPTLRSDPPLPQSDILSLMLGSAPDVKTVEQRTYGSPQEQQQRVLQAAGAALLMSPLTSRVGSVVERTGTFDTVQITPTLANADDTSITANPSARITLGKRISPRVYLTYSRLLTGPQQDEVIVLEYDQSDRVSWVLSRNEDRTFALDFRIRYAF